MQKEGSRLLYNLLIVTSGKISSMVIQFVTMLILSHILKPEDFGAVAMCSIFLTISEMLIDSGMAGSIIYHQDVKEIELHTLFWTNLFISLVIYIFLFFTADWIAIFYKTAIMGKMIKVIGISAIIYSFCLIQNTLLLKSLQFKTQNKILILSTLLSSIVVLILCYFNLGIWVLVAQPVLLKLFQVIFFTYYGSYRPKLQFSLNSLKRHWNFGSKLLGASFLKLIYDNLYIQTIGKIANLKEAGYYYQAKRFNDMPTDLLTFPLDKVVFPSLVKSDNMVYQMEKIIKIFALVVIPLLTMGSLVSRELIVILLGANWINSGWMLSFMFIGTIWASLEVLNRCFLKATGKIGLFFKFDIIKRFVNVLVVIISIYWSTKGLLIAFIINGLLSWLFNCVALEKAIKFNLKDQIYSVSIVALLAFLPYVLVYCIFLNFSINVWVDAFFKSMSYVSLYALLVFFFKRNDINWMFLYVKNI